ncbi:hypothetical protein BDN67DRAFT_364097 [Paxillus ammoniavirescens]|nr:hypothetical protein BDN67DRAFT_364097 [Paxillus ammoniavirescens]
MRTSSSICRGASQVRSLISMFPLNSRHLNTEWLVKKRQRNQYRARLSLRNRTISETTLPAFPSDVHTCPLLIIEFALIKAGGSVEVERSTTLGFW